MQSLPLNRIASHLSAWPHGRIRDSPVLNCLTCAVIVAHPGSNLGTFFFLRRTCARGIQAFCRPHSGQDRLARDCMAGRTPLDFGRCFVLAVSMEAEVLWAEGRQFVH